MRPALSILVAGMVVAALAGCGATGAASVSRIGPTGVASTAAVPSPVPSDPLADVDAALQKADGAAQQSQSDLQSGDAAAATDDTR
jgi:hypothetical protein